MVASSKDIKKMYGTNSDCTRTIGGNCVGNCRKTSNNDCTRTIGGNCVGNCRKVSGR